MAATARRMFELVEPIGSIPYFSDEATVPLLELGFTDFWDTYFAGRAAPLGHAPAQVVDALFYNFAPGEVNRHIPHVWQVTTPEAVLAARRAGCAQALRSRLGELVDSPALSRATELLMIAASSAPVAGRPMYAALRACPLPDDGVELMFHAASLLREHRGDGHIAVLVAEGVGGLEAHALHALSSGMRAHEFGRLHHLPRAQVDAAVATLAERELLDSDGWLNPEGVALKRRIEARTDALAAPPYAALTEAELAELSATLEPVAQRLT